MDSTAATERPFVPKSVKTWTSTEQGNPGRHLFCLFRECFKTELLLLLEHCQGFMARGRMTAFLHCSSHRDLD